MRSRLRSPLLGPIWLFPALLSGFSPAAAAESPVLDGSGFRVVADPQGGFRIEASPSGEVWKAGPFQVRRDGGWRRVEGGPPRLENGAGAGAAIVFPGDPSVSISLARGKRSVEISVAEGAGREAPEVMLMASAFALSGAESFLVIPCREGLLLPAGEGPAFRRAFGTSEYEGCHMDVIGLVQGGAAALVTWDDAYVTPQVTRSVEGGRRELSLDVMVKGSARSVLFTPLGKGGLAELAAGYREIAREKGLRVGPRKKVERSPALERLIGASNFKLWTCLERKMSEDSKGEESVQVHWTFEQAAEIAEHLKNDVGIDRCLFTLGGWIRRGYDCQHPDILPAAPECGGNEGLRKALERIRALGYADSLHDNYQDIYRDSPSWSEELVQKRPDGSLAGGGRWLGGRAYLVCARRQLELARRPQNLAEVKRLFQPLTYFIDTTYAAGPQECFDPAHPLSRNDDIRWKIALSDHAREVFGVFGSECGREWAVPHSDFFEGLVGVGGKYFHNLDPAELGATVIPFFEMVHHDDQIAWGKYEFDPEGADEYVLHHVACARPLHHHDIPEGLYWKRAGGDAPPKGAFTRADGGWAEGFCRTDRFLKNTHEVLGPLHRATAEAVLERIEFLAPDRSLRRMVFGGGTATVTANFGTAGAKVASVLGGEVILPRWGFLVESPRFAAFLASRFGGIDYPGGSLFTVTSLDGKPLGESARVRVFHGFGGASIAFRGRQVDVRREEVLDLSGR